MSAKFSGHFQQKDWAQVTFSSPITVYPFTVSFWAKLPGDAYAEAVYFSIKDADAYYLRHAADNAGSHSGGEAGRVGIHQQRTGSGGGTSYKPNFNNALPYAEWVLHTIVVEGGSDITVYINGKIVASWDTADFRNMMTLGGVDYLILANSGVVGATHRSNAYFAEFAIYEAALTQEQTAMLLHAKPDAIGVTLKHYWKLETDWLDSVGGDALVYNPLAGNPIIWSGTDHPALVGAASLTALTTSPFLLNGVKYETADLPRTVPATVLGFLERSGIGSGTYTDGADKTITMNREEIIDGATLAALGSYSLPIGAAGLVVESGAATLG